MRERILKAIPLVATFLAAVLISEAFHYYDYEKLSNQVEQLEYKDKLYRLNDHCLVGSIQLGSGWIIHNHRKVKVKYLASGTPFAIVEHYSKACSDTSPCESVLSDKWREDANTTKELYEKLMLGFQVMNCGDFASISYRGGN